MNGIYQGSICTPAAGESVGVVSVEAGRGTSGMAVGGGKDTDDKRLKDAFERGSRLDDI